MKKIIIILSWFALIACAYGGQPDPVSEAQALLEQKEYSRAFGLFNRALRGRTLSPLQRAQALKSQAQFYEDFMGNPDGALRLYRKILETKLPESHPAKSLANNEISRLNSLKKKYSEQDALLNKSRSLSSRGADKNKIKEHILQLQALIGKHPGYYKLVEVYYYLGLNYMSVEKYGTSRKLFEKCVQLKPCISFYLPVGTQARIAQERWIVTTIKKIAWALIGVLLIFTVISFYMSRPWRWLKIRHLAFGLVMVVLWWAIFTGSHKYFGEAFQTDTTIAGSIGAQQPCFVNATPTSPGAKIAKHLFLYGLVATLGMFVFSIGTSKLKYMWITILINAMFGLLLFASLGTVFYMRYCDQQGIFKAKAENIFSLLNGHLYFIQAEPEPSILTNPKAYPNLATRKITDIALQQWVKQHCPLRSQSQNPNLLEKRRPRYEQRKK